MYVKHFYLKFQYWFLRCECKLQVELIDLIDDVLIPKATQTPEKFYMFKIRFFVENAMGASRNALVEATQKAFEEAYDILNSKVREGLEARFG